VDEDLLRILDNRAGFHIRRVDEEFNCGKVRLYKADRILYNFETIWESVDRVLNMKLPKFRIRNSNIIEEFYYVATMFDFHLKSRGKHNYLKILKERLPFVEKHHLSRLSIPTPRSTYSKKQRDECVKEVILNLGPKATVDEIISVASKILCERRVPHTINHVHHVCRVRRNLVDRRSIKQKILDVVKEEYIPYNKVITAKDVRHIAKKIDVDVDAVRKGLNGLIKSGDIPRELRLTQQELRNMNIEKAIKLMEDYIIENNIDYISYNRLVRESGILNFRKFTWASEIRTRAEILKRSELIKRTVDRKLHKEKIVKEINKRLESLAELVGGFEKLDEYSIYGLWITLGGKDTGVSAMSFNNMLYEGLLLVKREYIPSEDFRVSIDIANNRIKRYLSNHTYKSLRELWRKSGVNEVLKYSNFTRFILYGLIEIPDSKEL
ncbi:MAG: hypothetical protein J7K22_03715, partial [Nanoarchaeota archaeon]|nr:hypothetical protein [Nanoarchaeota archaeon]